jgi:MFS family permease
LLGGTIGMAIALFVVAVTFVVSGAALGHTASIVAVVSLAVYTGSFAIGLGPVFWLLISEIYPARIRGKAMSIATIANWGANFLVAVSFLTLLNAISNAGTFFLMGFLSLAAVGYFWRKVPETQGLTLEEIEREMTTRPRRPQIDELEKGATT